MLTFLHYIDKTVNQVIEKITGNENNLYQL